MHYKNLDIKENHPLKKLTTFKIGGPARFLVEIGRKEEIKEAIEFAREKKAELLVLGGGSNMLVADKGFNGLVIKVNIKGVKVLKDNDGQVIIKAAAGEVWDGIAGKAIKSGWWGLENMSAIPGDVGGFVAQNAGAYGAECGDVLIQVEIYDTADGQFKRLNKKQCELGYRSSWFSRHREQYIITEAVLKLNKKGRPKLDYPDLKKYFADKKLTRPDLAQIRQAVIQIRRQKLPNWGVYGNAGSFIKNIVLSEAGYQRLRKKFIRNFDQRTSEKLADIKRKFSGSGAIKIPSAFLLDICGLKGARAGGAKVHEKQPLVIVNETGQATADEVMRLFQKIRRMVYEKTGVKLEPEVRLIGFRESERKNYFKL